MRNVVDCLFSSKEKYDGTIFWPDLSDIFFLTMKPSGFLLAHMNELTVQPFATAKILLILLCR